MGTVKILRPNNHTINEQLKIDGLVKSLFTRHCEPATRLVGEPLDHELGAEWLKSCRLAESEQSDETIS
jgi:hypothetical protein